MSVIGRLSMRGDADLNLIPLIDVMSVLVAFLLIYSADVEIVQNTKGVEIPHSSAEERPLQSVVVMITKDHLFVQGEPVATIAEIRGAGTATIESLRNVLNRPLVAGQIAAGDPDIASREITVIADKSLPFDVVRRVMATCTSSAYGKISLAVLEKDGAAGPAST
jgi:biopolymer transport protein ExbD